MKQKKRRRGTELEDEAWNKSITGKRKDWKWRDIKKFGWNAPRKKKRKYGFVGHRWWIEEKKRDRKIVRSVQHKLLFHIPMSLEEIEKVKYIGWLYWEAEERYRLENMESV